MTKKPKKKSKNMAPGTDPHAQKKAHARLAAPNPTSQRPAAPTQDAKGRGRIEPQSDTRTNVTLDQRRAQFALGKVQEVDAEYPVLPPDGSKSAREKARDYRSYVRGLPALIIANGLGQAVALELAQSKRSQGGESHGLLLDHLTAWLVEKDGWGPASPYLGAAKPETNGQYRTTELIERIATQSEADFTRAQTEALAFLKWLKTFAEALIEPRDPDDGRESGDTSNDGNEPAVATT